MLALPFILALPPTGRLGVEVGVGGFRGCERGRVGVLIGWDAKTGNGRGQPLAFTIIGLAHMLGLRGAARETRAFGAPVSVVKLCQPFHGRHFLYIFSR